MLNSVYGLLQTLPDHDQENQKAVDLNLLNIKNTYKTFFCMEHKLLN